MFLFRTPKVYLEINKSYILIGALKEKYGVLSCDVYEQQEFTSLEIGDGAMYNLKKICSFIEKALDKHRLKGARAVVCCPYFAESSDVKKEFSALQVSLCVCKAGLRIEALYDERILLR
jgi:Tfp pilus assembly PilM family ATPase